MALALADILVLILLVVLLAAVIYFLSPVLLWLLLKPVRAVINAIARLNDSIVHNSRHR